MYVDIHAHLDFEGYDHEEALHRARDKGVTCVVTAGIDKESNRESLALSKKYKEVSCALGLYPAVLEKEAIEEEVVWIQKQKTNPKFLLIGEIGLDYQELEDRTKQTALFERMLDLAKELNKPVLIHSRKAEADVIDILEKKGMKNVIMHCFGGKKALVKRCIENKWFFSIPANITRASHFQMIVKETPIGQLLTETDAPFLSPDPKRQSEPADVTITVKEIAKIKGLTEEETKKLVFMNVQRLS